MMTALWLPPVTSYAAMASSTETTASTSTVGVTPSRTSGTSGMPPLELMETSPPLTTVDLLLTAGVGRGTREWTLQQAPTTPGPCQPGPRVPPPQMPTPRGAGSHHINPLPAAGFSTFNPRPWAECHPTCLSEPGSGEAGW